MKTHSKSLLPASSLKPMKLGGGKLDGCMRSSLEPKVFKEEEDVVVKNHNHVRLYSLALKMEKVEQIV